MAINRVIIEGNLTRDVEMRATASGLAVAGFTVAVNEKRKNAEGEYVDAPVFVKCSLFGTRAEKLSKYLLKGTKVTIDGKLRYSQWVKGSFPLPTPSMMTAPSASASTSS